MNFLLAMDRVAFSIGKLDIYWYAIFVTTGILCALLTAGVLARKRNLSYDFILELFLWVVILAVVFCRVFYVVPRIGSEYFLDSWDGFKEIFNLRNGGLTIIGGIFGGLLGIICCCLRTKEYSIARTGDIVVLALFVGQIIGRWGNFANQELYGQLIENPSLQWFPFAVYIDYCSYCHTGGYHHAVFFYEGVLNFIGLMIGLTMFRKGVDKDKPMMIGIFYLLWYGIVRGSLDFLKEGNMTIPGTEIGVVQVICYCMSAVCLVLIVLYAKGIINLKIFDKYKRKPSPDCTSLFNDSDGCEIMEDEEK